MGGDDFLRTRMGQRLFEATMPKIADQLERLNASLEAFAADLRKRSEATLIKSASSPPDRAQ